MENQNQEISMRKVTTDFGTKLEIIGKYNTRHNTGRSANGRNTQEMEKHT
jgi:hypothetical protein